MLLNLHVKNMALIKEIDIDFAEGLNVITGETGAGKTLLLGSVELALGGKFSPDMLRKGATDALVELVFSVEKEETKRKLEKLGFTAEDGELIITRKISGGRASAKINGENCTASMQKKVAELLINIHGQRENQVLLKPGSQLKILDSYGKKALDTLLADTKQAYREYKSEEANLEKYSMNEEKRLREASLLEHEIKEITEANIKEGEEEELSARFRRMSNSREILETLGKVYDFSGYNSGAGYMIGRAVKEISAIAEMDEELGEIASALEDAEGIISDTNRQISSYLGEFSFSEQEVVEVEARLDKIHMIQAKYGSTVEKIEKYKAEAEGRLEFLQNYETEKIKAEGRCARAKKALEECCIALSGKRREIASEFSDALSRQLIELNFPQALIEVEFSRAPSYREDGFDDIELCISVNPGEPLKPLVKVASGGELSRTMLALKNIIADEENTETLIFDEIDAGISGRTAQRVSEKMASIAIGHQILCVTHLAQIAAMADRHFVIEKNVENGETITSVRLLQSEEQINELARILGGSKITDAVLANAREMKELADEYKSGLGR